MFCWVKEWCTVFTKKYQLLIKDMRIYVADLTSCAIIRHITNTFCAFFAVNRNALRIEVTLSMVCSASCLAFANASHSAGWSNGAQAASVNVAAASCRS